MTNRFMLSVAAAALIAGAGFANAQGTGGHQESSGSMAQQSATPSAGGGSAMQGREATEPSSPSSGMKSTQSEQKSGMSGKNERADESPGQKSNMSSDNDHAKGGKDMKAEGRQDHNNMKAEGRNGSAESRSHATTGQAGAGGKLSTEQRTKITTVIREQHVRPVEHVNFSISIGTRVPHDVSFHRLPSQIVTIYPEWRGYEYFLVRNQIIVVDPRTFEIVAVLEA